MNLIKLNIRGISYSQTQVGAYALILEEEFGEKKLPIIIGSFEAQAIALALEKDIVPARPLTHDLFFNFSNTFGIKINSVCIYKLEDGVFFSNIIAEDKDGKIVEIDARTSDSIALAVRFNSPIYVLESVMEKAGIELEMIDESEEKKIQQALEEIEKELSDAATDSKGSFKEFSDEDLNQMMNDAVENEDYEKAAKIRDELDKRDEN